VRLFNDDVLEFFDATRLEVSTELSVEDDRFYVGIVVDGAGWIEGDFGSEPIRKGETFACAASLAHRVRADGAPLSVVRCMGPARW
jgi:mannose-6-phosphate isomerase class I